METLPQVPNQVKNWKSISKVGLMESKGFKLLLGKGHFWKRSLLSRSQQVQTEVMI